MDSKRDLVSEYRQAAMEYLQWLEAAKNRFEETPKMGDRLVSMYSRGNLYGWMSQKGLYQYRVKLDPEIWRELQRRWAEDWPALQEDACLLSESDYAEWEKIALRMERYHEALTQAAEDWFFKEGMKKPNPSGCGLWVLAMVCIPVGGWWFWG